MSQQIILFSWGEYLAEFFCHRKKYLINHFSNNKQKLSRKLKVKVNRTFPKTAMFLLLVVNLRNDIEIVTDYVVR